MKLHQQGFTLIELMIVIAIIGILAATGIGFYLDYIKRTHVSEGLFLSDSARLSVLEYYNSTNKKPTNNQEAGLSEPETYSGTAVTSVEVKNGDIEITFNEKVVAGKTIVYEISADTSATSWDCTGGTLLNRYRPSNCR